MFFQTATKISKKSIPELEPDIYDVRNKRAKIFEKIALKNRDYILSKAKFKKGDRVYVKTKIKSFFRMSHCKWFELPIHEWKNESVVTATISDISFDIGLLLYIADDSCYQPNKKFYKKALNFIDNFNMKLPDTEILDSLIKNNYLLIQYKLDFSEQIQFKPKYYIPEMFMEKTNSNIAKLKELAKQRNMFKKQMQELDTKINKLKESQELNHYNEAKVFSKG